MSRSQVKPKARKTISVATTSDRLAGTGHTKVYQLIRAGELEACKLGRRTLVFEDSLEALMDRLPRL